MLKNLPTSVIEQALADVLGEMAGEALTASVVRIDFASASDPANCELTIRLRPAQPLVKQSLSVIGVAGAAPRESDEPATDQSIAGLTGKALNEQWSVGAQHSLYHHEGRWYHKLRRFPGALFDSNGYVLFPTEEDFQKSPHLAITQDVHVPGGISSLPGYTRIRK